MLLVLVSFSHCKKELSPLAVEESTSSTSKGPKIKIMVMPGTSYLDPSLMIDCLADGSDFRNDLSTDNVIEEFSKPILDAAVSKILSEEPDLLFLPGELTFNGEKIGHEALAEILKKISEQGIKVFVIPGNKDVNNPSAKAYSGSGSTPTPSITAQEFEKLYYDFGFKHAISRDPNSLSYLTRAFNKVWVLGIDETKNQASSTGTIKPQTMEWMLGCIAKAQEENVTLLTLSHHSVTEQWVGEAIYGKLYIIENHTTVENTLTDAGFKIVFTATANDITMFSKGKNSLFDISTGLLLSPPCPIRMITLDQNKMDIKTHYITSIDATIPGGVDFLTYSNNIYEQNMTRFFITMFKKNFGQNDEQAAFYAPHFAKALHAFYVGDEQISPEENEASLAWPNQSFRSLLLLLYTDLQPPDEQYVIDLN